MPLHRCRIALLLGSLCGPPLAHATSLPMDWAEGSSVEYSAWWARNSRVAAQVPGLKGEQRGQVRISVIKRTPATHLLHWKPVLDGGTLAPDQPLEEPGVAIWRLPLALGLELKLSADGSSELVALNNRAAVAAQAADGVRALTEKAGLTLDCGKQTDPASENILCRLISSPQRIGEWVLRPVSPFFACTGLTLPEQARSEWLENHPDPRIGDAIRIRYVRELPGFVPGKPTVQIRTVAEPDAQQLEAWMREKLGGVPGLDNPVLESVSGLRFRIETDCTMDRASGWPLRIEQRSSVGTGTPYEGSETVRFERTGYTQGKS